MIYIYIYIEREREIIYQSEGEGPRTDYYCTPWVRGYGGVVWAAGSSVYSIMGGA